MSVPDLGNQGCNFLSGADPVSVEKTTVDEFCERLNRIDLIRIDVEGSEVELLRGADRTIRPFRPILMIAANPLTLRKFGHTAAHLVEAVCRYGYRLHYAAGLG
jgi:hypothetical protein